MTHEATPQADGHPGPTIYDRVVQILAEELGCEAHEIMRGSSLLDDLGADSLDRINVTLRLEEAFGIEIPDREAETLRTPADIETYLASRMAAAQDGCRFVV